MKQEKYPQNPIKYNGPTNLHFLPIKPHKYDPLFEKQHKKL